VVTRIEEVDSYTDLEYVDGQPAVILTRRRNWERALESVEQHLGRPVTIGRWHAHENDDGLAQAEILAEESEWCPRRGPRGEKCAWRSGHVITCSWEEEQSR
jgi:hypothetical protein